MQQLNFTEALDNIYAAFGKKYPEDRIAEAIFRRIENLPDEFLDYARERLCDMDRLPANLGAFMANDLWWEFRDKHPEKFVREEQEGCGKCHHGLRIVYAPDGEAIGRACDCCTDQRLIEKLGRGDDFELQRLGLITHIPLPEGPRYSDKYRAAKMVQEAIAAADEPQRQEYIDCLKEMERHWYE